MRVFVTELGLTIKVYLVVSEALSATSALSQPHRDRTTRRFDNYLVNSLVILEDPMMKLL
jgi:hypothetical protein